MWVNDWLVAVCRPDLAYSVARLQSAVSWWMLMLMDWFAMLRRPRTKDCSTPRPRCFFDNLMIVAIQDASYAVDVAPRLAGLHEGDAWSALPVALEWRSTVIRRVCRSSLQAESLPLLLGTNEADFYGLHFAQWQGKMDATIWVVKAQDFTAVMWARDCFSLLVHLLNPAAGSVTDTRLAEIWRQGGEEVGDPLGQDAPPEQPSTSIWWTTTDRMIADGLTKKLTAPGQLCIGSDEGAFRKSCPNIEPDN